MLQTDKLATKAGLVDKGPMNIMSKSGNPTRNGVDKALSGAKPFSKEVNVIVEAKGRAVLPNDPTDMLGTARGNVQGSAAYNVERIQTAATSGNANAAQVMNKINAAGSHESFLVGSEIAPGSQAQVWKLTGSGGGTPLATPVTGLPDVSPIQTMVETSAANVAAQGYQQQ